MSAEAVPTPTGAAHALDRRNTWTFGSGTLGRDMLYTFVSMYLAFYLTDVLDLSDTVMWWTNGIMLGARVFDAFLDFGMGMVVDNTRSRWGRYKPWIAVGMVASALMTVLLFTDFGLRGAGYVALFAVVYLLWGMTWTVNDIPYWSLLPALSLDPHVRERMGSVAKVFGTIGLFSVVIGVPFLGAHPRTWQLAAIALVAIMVAFQCITLVGVRQPNLGAPEDRHKASDMLQALRSNDQVKWTGICMVLFFIGYQTTTAAGLYYFKYVYRQESMYSIFGAVLGLANVIGFATFPILMKHVSRKRLFTISTAMIVVGYVGFALSPMNIAILGSWGLIMFLAEAWIVMLMMVFLADTIEYGQWKTGMRMGSATFALQPFIFKVSGAVANAIILATVVVAGINSAVTPDDVTPAGITLFKAVMLGLPVVLIAISWALYLRKYKIDPETYARMVADLRERGEIG